MTLFQSAGGDFEVEIPDALLRDIRSRCNEMYPNETGGILIGAYDRTLRRAQVMEISGPPVDSKSGRTWFRRGVSGLRELCLKFWKRTTKAYYLGEWHFHPGASPVPSNYDIVELNSIANDSLLKCPEPILLIVGGSDERMPVTVTIAKNGCIHGLNVIAGNEPACGASIITPPL
jgi:integrative and conjugative element protein (TIGR02256 family)